MTRQVRFLFALLAVIALPHAAAAGPVGDYGDAPYAALAYPSKGVIGNFPTCFNSPVGFVGHLAGKTEVHFGQSVDFESDGNGGLCAWPPYDNDECSGPPDAGLIRPDSYTISGGVEMTCVPGAAGIPIGRVCTTASWGPNIDIDVTNLWPSTMFVNVLVDWNQDGNWAGASACGAGAAPEHVLQNFPVPSGFSGPLSLLAPPSFKVGPNPGFVWVRFTIGEVPVPAGWNGAHTFDLGETEDYLLRVADVGGGVGGGKLGDYGDAPDGAIAYPSTAVVGQFPTCVGGASGYVVHGSATNVVHFGSSVDYETDGNGGTCTWPAYNNDECFGPPDAGLIVPDGYTINAAMAVEPCSGPGRPLGPPCATANWGAAANIDIDVTNLSNAVTFVNLLVDWNGDGSWGGSTACAVPAPEHALVDFPVPPGFSGPLSVLGPPSFQIGPNAGFAWARFTIGEVPVGAGWTGAHSFDLGESEDYLLRIGNAVSGVAEIPEAGAGLRLEPARPNPFRASSVIAYTLDRAVPVRVTVTDASGRTVTHLLNGVQNAGRHQVSWNGRSDGGEAMRAGIYFVRVQSGATDRSEKVALTK